MAGSEVDIFKLIAEGSPVVILMVVLYFREKNFKEIINDFKEAMKETTKDSNELTKQTLNVIENNTREMTKMSILFEDLRNKINK
jgi:predicted transcriptional regulator